MSSDHELSFRIPGHSRDGNSPARPSVPGPVPLRQGPEAVVVLIVIIINVLCVLWLLGDGHGAAAAAAAVGIAAVAPPCVRFCRARLPDVLHRGRSVFPRQSWKGLSGWTVPSWLIKPRCIPPGRRSRRKPGPPSGLARAAERVTMTATRTGRPENPLSPDGGPVAELARELRRMRNRADLTYHELAAKTGWTPSTLTAAADGQRLPSWPVTRAWVQACGGNGNAVLDLYERACIVVGRPAPSRDLSAGKPPDPAAAATAAELLAQMARLRVWAGNPSLRTLNRRSGGRLPASTVSEVLRKNSLPRRELVLDYVRACGIPDVAICEWERAWNVIRSREVNPAANAQLSQAVLERQHRGAWAGLRDFLKWLSGTPAELLPRTPADRAGYTGLGGAMLLTSMASALSAAWAAHVVLTPKWPAAGVAGMAWCVGIASLDRMVVASIHRGHGRRNLFVIISRVAISLLLALLIATPIALRIFAPEVNAQVVRTQYAAQVAAAQSQANCEVFGGSGCHPGQGPAYAAALKAHHQQGLLSNLAALNQITDHSKTIAIVRWLLFGLFTLLGCAPAIVKALKVRRGAEHGSAGTSAPARITPTSPTAPGLRPPGQRRDFGPGDDHNDPEGAVRPRPGHAVAPSGLAVRRSGAVGAINPAATGPVKRRTRPAVRIPRPALVVCLIGMMLSATAVWTASRAVNRAAGLPALPRAATPASSNFEKLSEASLEKLSEASNNLEKLSEASTNPETSSLLEKLSSSLQIVSSSLQIVSYADYPADAVPVRPVDFAKLPVLAGDETEQKTLTLDDIEGASSTLGSGWARAGGWGSPGITDVSGLYSGDSAAPDFLLTDLPSNTAIGFLGDDAGKSYASCGSASWSVTTGYAAIPPGTTTVCISTVSAPGQAALMTINKQAHRVILFVTTWRTKAAEL
jgi:DNA-binding XRE family transcriptional regulator